jgi:hypothetical protein
MKQLIEVDDFKKHLIGFNVVDCVVRRADFLYFLACEDYTQHKNWQDGMDPPNETTLKRRVIAFMRYKPASEQWGQTELTGFDLALAGLALTPVEHVVVVNSSAKVYTSGKGMSGMEGQLEYSQTGRRGVLQSLKTVGSDLYFVGWDRSLGIRIGKEQWHWLNEKIPVDPDSGVRITCGFRDIDGTDESDLYACGDQGDLWNCSGGAWRKCAFPSNVTLNTVCCAPDGTVYLSGYVRETYHGKDDTWTKIAKPELSLPFKDMIWYEDRVWCTNDYGVWWIQGNKLTGAKIPSDIKVCAGNLSARDGVLLLAGYFGAAVLQRGQWKVIFHYNALAQKAGS